MFCVNCGKKIQDDAKFCPNCGAKVGQVVDQPAKPAEKDNPFILEVDGKKFDAFSFARDNRLYYTSGFKSDVHLATELEKLTGCGTSAAVKMIDSLRSNEALKKAVVETDDQTGPTCPKCGSKQIKIYEKGYSATKGIIGGVLTGGIGLVAGFHGRHSLRGKCLNCGHKWKI
jgi:RNA polymerase subunit RPABC4/transcription elongation factor Spt4